MTVYILNLVAISFLALLLYLLNQHNTLAGKKTFVIVTAIQLIFLQGLRSFKVGADTQGYLRFYDSVKKLDWGVILEDRFEIGYKLINKLFALLGLGDQLFLFVISSLIIVPVATFIYNHSHNVYLSFYFYITLGFYGASFNTLRQNIAYGFVLLSFKFIKERKLVSFLITVLIASSFHISALVFLPAYFLAKIKLTKISTSILIIVSILIFIFRYQIMNFVINSVFDEYSLVQTGAYQWLIFNILLFIGTLMFYPTNNRDTSSFFSSTNIVHNNKSQDNENNVIRMYYILTLIGIITMLFATTASNAMRISNFYYMFIILLIPAALKKINNRYIKAIVTMVLFIGMGFIYIYFLNTPGDHQFVPYEFYWE